MEKSNDITGQIRIISTGQESKLEELYQEGSLKVLAPKTYGLSKELVLINTSGGVLGGDKYNVAIDLKKNSKLIMSSQAAERVYKSRGKISDIKMRANLSGKSSLIWIPYETILFNESSMARSFDINISKGSSAIFFDHIVFGRIASGEVLISSKFKDNWLVKYDKKPIFLDRLTWSGELPTSTPLLGNSLAICSILYFGDNEELYKKRADEINAKIIGNLVSETKSEIKFGSTTRNNSVILRIASKNATTLRKVAMDAMKIFCSDELMRTRYQ